MDEKVWVVSNEDLEKAAHDLKRFAFVPFPAVEKAFEKCFFKDRSLVETDESLKQIIPYVVFQKETGEILTVKRTKKQSETRLHDKYSVGIGGHINPVDEGPHPTVTFFNGLNREINEELNVDKINKLEYLGVIYDNENEVSRVHVGMLFLAKVTDASIEEKENFEAGWLLPSEIKKLDKEKFETWSLISLEQLDVLF